MIFLDIQPCLLPYSRLIGVRADDGIFAVGQLQPWVRPATPKALGFAGRALGFKARSSGIVTISLESRLGHARIRMALGEMKLLASVLLHSNNITDISKVVLRFDEGIQHVDEDQPLIEGCLRAGLPIERVVGVEAFLKQWIDVILKNPRQVDGVFFKVLKQIDCIEEGAIIHLCTQLHCLSICVKVALPNVVKDVMRFNQIARNEYHKHS